MQNLQSDIWTLIQYLYSAKFEKSYIHIIQIKFQYTYKCKIEFESYQMSHQIPTRLFHKCPVRIPSLFGYPIFIQRIGQKALAKRGQSLSYTVAR